MSSHPAKINFQFTYTEVYHADLRRFNLLFGNFDQLAPHESRVLRLFCGCLSITFDPALHGQAPSPVEHPAFHRFATRFLAEVPSLPYMANLQEDSLLRILMGSLQEITVIEVEGSSAGRITSRGEEFVKAVAAMKDQAESWAKKAGNDAQEVSDRRVALQQYFDRPILARNWS
jgi:hypothetical protein